MKHRESSPWRSSIKEVPKLEITAILPHQRYVFLESDYTLPVIDAVDLNVQQVEFWWLFVRGLNEPLL